MKKIKTYKRFTAILMALLVIFMMMSAAFVVSAEVSQTEHSNPASESVVIQGYVPGLKIIYYLDGVQDDDARYLYRNGELITASEVGIKTNGDNVFVLTIPAGYEIESIVCNGITITYDRQSDGTLIISGLTGDSELNIRYVTLPEEDDPEITIRYYYDGEQKDANNVYYPDGTPAGSVVTVKKGEDNRFQIIVPEGYAIDKIYFNGEDVTGLIDGDGFIDLPGIDESTWLDIFYKSIIPDPKKIDIIFTADGEVVDWRYLLTEDGTPISEGFILVATGEPGKYKLIIPDGYELINITLNGVDITSYLDEDGYLNLPGIDEDSELIINYKSIQGETTTTTVEIETTEESETSEVSNTSDATEITPTTTTTKPSSGDKPNTGDNTDMTLWIVIMAAALVLVLVLVFVKRRRRDDDCPTIDE